MEQTEAVIRSILGLTGGSIQPLVCAVDVTAGLLFAQKWKLDDVKPTKHIYPAVAGRLDMRAATAAKAVERLANACWDTERPELLQEVIGRCIQRPKPSVMVKYLAVHAVLGLPFYDAVDKFPELLF